MDIVKQLEILYAERQDIKAMIVRMKQQRRDTSALENQLQYLNEQIQKAERDLKKSMEHLKTVLRERKK